MRIALDTPRGTPASVDADTVAAVVAVLVASRAAGERDSEPARSSRWRSAARVYEPYDA